ncbi:MAG TPA: hypothetical protein VGP64_13100 [Polyangia bacterium]
MKRTATSRLWGWVLGGFLLGSPSIARADAPLSAQSADQAAQTAEQQVEQAKELGGSGYKSGAVQRAESEATHYGCLSTEAPARVSSPEAQHYAELADQYRQMGASGYKTGLVQRAEADARRAQARAAEDAAQPAAPQTYPRACSTNDPWMQSPDCWK